jgi:hypothetical protein
MRRVGHGVCAGIGKNQVLIGPMTGEKILSPKWAMTYEVGSISAPLNFSNAAITSL